MRPSWFEPYLWIHVAGIFVFPLWMGLCLMGLATSVSVLPVWLEVVTIALLGAGPILAMQLLQPFNIFSALMVAVPTECLDEDRRRVLATFQDREHQLLAVAIAALLFCFLLDAYHLAPLVEALSPVRSAPGTGISRMVLATVGFLGANLFLQVPMAALRVMVLPESALTDVTPVQVEDAAEQFTTFGWQWAGLVARDETEQPDTTTSTKEEPESASPPSDVAQEAGRSGKKSETKAD